MPGQPELPPALDTQAFQALRDLCAEEEPAFFVTLMASFLKDAATHLATICTARDTGDATALERAAHVLKSSSANIGALHFSDLCEGLQTSGRNGAVAEVAPLVDQLVVEFDRVQQALHREYPI